MQFAFDSNSLGQVSGYLANALEALRTPDQKGLALATENVTRALAIVEAVAQENSASGIVDLARNMAEIQAAIAELTRQHVDLSEFTREVGAKAGVYVKEVET
jgi:hypothetical protein